MNRALFIFVLFEVHADNNKITIYNRNGTSVPEDKVIIRDKHLSLSMM